MKYISQRLRSNANKFLERVFVYFAIFEFKMHIYDFLVYIFKMYKKSCTIFAINIFRNLG